MGCDFHLNAVPALAMFGGFAVVRLNLLVSPSIGTRTALLIQASACVSIS